MKQKPENPSSPLQVESSLDSIESAINELKNGKVIIVVDDENRENEGDFITSAEKITPEVINFMATHGRGMICAPITGQRAKELKLDYMVTNVENTSAFGTPFTVTIDLKNGNSTGISCFDRARTIKALTSSEVKPEDFLRPGHIFPLIARDGGVLERDGHTEATVDLARLAGLYPAGVLCEIMSEDGQMARLPELIKLAQKFNLKIISVKQLIKYQKEKKEIAKHPSTLEMKVNLAGETTLPTKYGTFQLCMFEQLVDKSYSQDLQKALPRSPEYHSVLIYGDLKSNLHLPILVRIHSECFTGDIFSSERCDCGEQLHKSMQMIVDAGCGILVYLKQEGRGIGALNKVKAYELQDKGYDTVTANHKLGFDTDLRDYTEAVKILTFLGVKRINLLTNNPLKISGIHRPAEGLTVEKRVPLIISPTAHNLNYLTTKRDKMGHLILNHKPI